MARIYLDARAAESAGSGIGRYCRGLVPALAARKSSHEIVVVRSSTSHVMEGLRGPWLDAPVSGSTRAGGLLLSTWKMRSVFRTFGRADIYHALFHILPVGIRQGREAPRHVIVTLHDLIWIDRASEVARSGLAAAWRRRIGLFAIPYALRHSDQVICNSQATADSARPFVSPARCTPIHLGVSEEFLAASVGTGPRWDRPYVAAFGVAKRYKNIGCLIRAYAEVVRAIPAARLVLIGDNGGAGREIEQLGLAHVVTVVHQPDDRTIKAVIAGADALVVPSTAEGFGLPVIEAMAVGTPVVVSKIPALLEVASDAALVFDPASPTELANVLVRLLKDPSLRQQLASRGLERVRQFTWGRAADETWAVYDRLLQHHHPAPTVHP